LVRCTAAWFDSSPITIDVGAARLALGAQHLAALKAASVPDSISFEATKAWLSGSVSTLIGWRLT
jgi:hypothetical protein